MGSRLWGHVSGGKGELKIEAEEPDVVAQSFRGSELKGRKH